MFANEETRPGAGYIAIILETICDGQTVLSSSSVELSRVPTYCTVVYHRSDTQQSVVTLPAPLALDWHISCAPVVVYYKIIIVESCNQWGSFSYNPQNPNTQQFADISKVLLSFNLKIFNFPQCLERFVPEIYIC